MKRFLLLFSAALLAQIGLAQQSSNLIIFAEQGTPFYAIVNGIKQNAEPQTNVKITGLTNPANQIKIIFKDQSIPSLDKQIYFQEMNVEATMKISWTKKGYKLKYFGEVPMGTATADASQNVIIYQTVEPVATSTPVVTTSTVTPTTQVNTPTTTTTTTVVEETTTVVSSSATPGSVQMNTNVTDMSTTQNGNENVSMNVSMGGAGFNMNVNINDNMGTPTTVNSTTMNHATGGMDVNTNMNYNESSTVTTTTTTTTTTSSADNVYYDSYETSYTDVAPEPVYYVDGYSGATGCMIPESETKSIIAAIDNESFSEDKMNVAKQATKNKCLTTDQVVEICNKFDFEEDKLDFAKYAYSRTYDIDNYYKVNSVLTYSSSKEELNEFINK